MAKKRDGDGETKDSPRSAAFLKEHARELQEQKEIPGESAEVDLEEEDDEQDDEDEGQTPRQRKRSNRYASLQESLETTKRELDETKRRAELADLSRQQHEMYARGVQQLLGTGPQAKSKEDEELERLAREQANLRDGFLGRRANLPQGQDLPRSEYDAYNVEQQKLQDKRSELVARRAIGPQQRGMTQHDVQIEAHRVMLLNRAPDVFGVPQYAQLAAFQYQAAKAKGLTEEQALSEAIEETRTHFKLKRSEPETRKSQLEKRRVAGPPSGNVATAQNKRVVSLTRAEQKMAETRYPKLAAVDPRKAWKKWAVATGAGDE